LAGRGREVSDGRKDEFQTTNLTEFDIARLSVLWGCPEWQGYATTGKYPVNRNNNGYSPNLYPTASPTNPPDPTKMPTKFEMQIRWRNATAWTFPGKAYKVSQWTRASERMLVADATLWFFQFRAVPAGGSIAPLGVGSINSGAWPGGNNYDRYRHGKYPQTEPAQYAPGKQQYKRTGGKVAYNVLFADGHAATLTDIRQGYKAVRMIDPP
jgi:prepilin-type processing-associated H-X9-DG protein